MANESIIYKMGVDNGNSVDEINEVSNALQGVDEKATQAATSGQKVQDSLQFTAGVAGGIAAVSGAMGLLGVTNEKTLKTISRLMQLQAIASGLMQVSTSFTKENYVVKRILIGVEKVRSFWMKQNIATQAVMTLGITALIAGVITLAANWEKWTKMLSESPQYKDSKVGKFFAAFKKDYGTISNLLKEAVTFYSALFSGKGFEAAAKLGRDQTKQLMSLQKAEGNLEKFRDKNEANAQTRIKRLQAIGGKEKEIYNEKKKLLVDEFNLIKQLIATEKGNTEENRRLKHELVSEKIALDKQYSDFVKAEAEKSRQEQLERDAIKEEEDKQTRARMNDDLFLEKRDFENLEVEAVISYEDRLLTAKKNANKELEKENKRMDEDSKKRTEKEIQRAEFEANMKYAIATQGVNGLISLGDIMIENSDHLADYQKGLALFQIGLDTAMAFARIQVPSAAAVALGPLGIALEKATNIASILGGIAKAKQLLSATNKPSKGGSTGTIPTPSFGGGGFGGSASITDSNINVDSDNLQPDVINQTNTNEGGVTKVVVVSSDITDMANDIAFVETVAEL